MAVKLEWKEVDGKKWFKFDKKLNERKFMYGNVLTVIFMLLLIALGLKLLSVVGGQMELLKTNPCALCTDLGFTCFVPEIG